jgi:hypothetical protein
MRKLIASVVALSFLGLVGSALADEATGKVREIDLAANTITLESGKTFKLAGAKVEGINPGDTVKIQYFEGDEGIEATEIVRVDM